MGNPTYICTRDIWHDTVYYGPGSVFPLTSGAEVDALLENGAIEFVAPSEPVVSEADQLRAQLAETQQQLAVAQQRITELESQATAQAEEAKPEAPTDSTTAEAEPEATQEA